MIKSQIIYPLAGFLGVISFIYLYKSMKKKYLSIYSEYISKKTICFFRICSVAMVLFFLDMFLDTSGVKPLIFVREYPLAGIWGFLITIYLYMLSCEKILTDIVEHISKIPNKEDYDYETLSGRLQRVKKSRKGFWLPIMMYALATYIILTK